jgi:uncharacterized protein (DUF433 family)
VVNPRSGTTVTSDGLIKLLRGDAHPRVTGCKADHGAFPTIEEARGFMKRRGVTEHKEVFKEGAGETAPLLGSQAFYAVADGKNLVSILVISTYLPSGFSVKIKLLTSFSGESGAELEIKKVSGSCHKLFRTRAQAEAFIEDWKDSYADIWRKAIREALDRGRRPADMRIRVGQILSLPESGDIRDELKKDKLSIKEEPRE